MSDLAVNLTGDQINAFVSQAVLNSTLGDGVKAAVERCIADMSKTYNNPFDASINRHVQELINQEIMGTHRDVLAAKVKASLDAYLTDEIVQKIVEAGIEKLRRNY